MYKVLIIEDDRVTSQIYKTKLEDEGYKAVIASDGQEGLQKFHNFNPDVVLLDMFLPKVSGLDILNHIRSNHTTQDCSVIAFSGSREHLREAEKAGASSILFKDDFTPTEIVARITNLIASAAIGEPTKAQLNEQPLETKPTTGRVLIVEDDLTTMTLVKGIVKKEGYIPETATDGMEGYKILIKDKDFDLAIFDINMPNLSGTDLLRLMRKDKRLEDTPVMLMSSERVSHISFESLNSGVIVFVPKPFTNVTLRAMFNVCLDTSRSIS